MLGIQDLDTRSSIPLAAAGSCGTLEPTTAPLDPFSCASWGCVPKYGCGLCRTAHPQREHGVGPDSPLLGPRHACKGTSGNRLCLDSHASAQPPQAPALSSLASAVLVERMKD